jgi:CsoR family transcriptional regulator, copper-sensing transcriptional repressor
MSHGYVRNDHKDARLKRLKRIEGQVRGLQRMIEEERYCIDILTQVSAASAALGGVALGVMGTTSSTASAKAAKRRSAK